MQTIEQIIIIKYYNYIIDLDSKKLLSNYKIYIAKKRIIIKR